MLENGIGNLKTEIVCNIHKKYIWNSNISFVGFANNFVKLLRQKIGLTKNDKWNEIENLESYFESYKFLLSSSLRLFFLVLLSSAMKINLVFVK